MTLVSVVIPAYNRAAAIGAALESVRRQTYDDWEAVVVDDGSHDGTAEIVDRLAHRDPRIRLVRHERNRGAQAARNTAIHSARGDWIAFLDSDDQFLPDSIGSRLQLALERHLSVVHSDCYMVEPGHRPRLYAVRPLAGWIYRDLLDGEGPVFPGLLVHRQALRRIGYLDERIVSYQEWDTTIRLAAHYPFGFEPTPTFVWDCRHANTISKNMRGNGRGYEQVFRKHRLAILRHGGPRALARHYQVAASWYVRANDHRATRRCRLMSLLWSSLDIGRVPRGLRRLATPLRRTRIPPLHRQASIDARELTDRLAELLKLDTGPIAARVVDLPDRKAHRVELSNPGGDRRLILKEVDDAVQYSLYTSLLEPLGLDSPEMHGHIRTRDGTFLVMDDFRWRPAGPADEAVFVQAVRWLVKKDTIAHDNIELIRRSAAGASLDRPTVAEEIDDALDVLEGAVKDDLTPLLSAHFWKELASRKALLHRRSERIVTTGRLTLCHGDFQLHNVLVAAEEAPALYVVDWRPRFGSVCIDLAGLVRGAPSGLRARLIAEYRSRIDFEDFESIYDDCELVLGVIDLASTLRRPLAPSAQQTARALQTQVIGALQLGLERESAGC